MAGEADAVHFALKDYAGPGRRVAACLIDLGVLIGLLLATTTLVGLWLVPPEVRARPDSRERQREVSVAMRPAQRPIVLGWLAAIPAYHVLLRKMRGGTLGYRLAGIRIVDAAGDPPPMKVLMRRFVAAVPFVLFFGLSYLACRRGGRRQAAHDQLCGTWLVRRGASPAGAARVAYQARLVGTYLLTYPDVEPLEEDPSSPPAAAGTLAVANDVGG
jgi:uncharacterized RDD family membrane protein YckC